MTRALWTHLVKDLRIEWRSLEAINSMLFFALLVVVLFSIAFDPRGAFSQQIAGGVLCVATMFASVSALNQAWAREIRHQVMDAQRMAPTPGAELFLAKVIANFLFVTIVQIVARSRFSRLLQPAHRGSRLASGSSCRSAPGPSSPTEPSLPRSPFAAATANCSCPLILFPIFFRHCLAWCRPPASIFTGDSDPMLWIKMLPATTSSSPPSAFCSSTWCSMRNSLTA